MKPARWLQETRKMRFEEAYGAWTEKRLSQEEAAQLLGVCPRTFRRYIESYKEDGMDGLLDKRLEQASHRLVPVDEAMRLLEQYQSRHYGWNVSHFHRLYRREGGTRSYTWVKNQLQKAGLVKPAKKRGKHRKRREPSALPGMMLHQDGSLHEWVPGKWWYLIVTMDDATNEHYSMFFCEQEGTHSSFRGVREVIDTHGLFGCLWTDRGSHYWHTPKANGKVDKHNLTQFGRAMAQLGIDMKPAYEPQPRGRGERPFRTHQDCLPKELALAGITDMEAANRYIREHYLPRFNEDFARPAREEGTAFVPCLNPEVLDDILCEHHQRTVGQDNCVQFNNLCLQIPPDKHRRHYVRAKVNVLRYPDGQLAVRHGPRELARYSADGHPLNGKKAAA